MNQLKTQIAKVWQLLTAPSTGETYQKTLSLTWTILKETGLLLWLVLCLGLVFGEWIWKTGYKTGWSTRNWINDLEKPSADRLFSETGKSLLEAGKSGAAMVLTTAKEQLGIPVEPTPPKPPAVAPAAGSAPTPAPTVASTPAKPTAPVASATESKPTESA